tara:strand:- start:161 stop:604 length:444 start_codon:yes stop_codon:yes gene_type:complete
MINELKKHLIEFEGIVLKPYKCTAGKTTIGIGRNLDDMGISEDEAMILLDNDIKNVVEEVLATWPWVEDLPPRARMVVIDLAFNMGVPTLSSFRNMLGCLKSKDWDGASENLLDSRYAQQVGRRAIYNAHLLETAGTEHSLPSKITF